VYVASTFISRRRGKFPLCISASKIGGLRGKANSNSTLSPNSKGRISNYRSAHNRGTPTVAPAQAFSAVSCRIRVALSGKALFSANKQNKNEK
jgi:hypothetical protein